LWPGSDLEFRGAAFPIGGDEAIDGLVTIPREKTREHNLSINNCQQILYYLKIFASTI
jgi:hypothetical protein